MKTTKRALLSSVMALVLCFTMLLGTTYAWFTDEVTSANNVIKSGNLDVVLEYYNGTEWVDVDGKSDILAGNLWEPGYVDVAYLRFKNNGTLGLKYQLGVNIADEVVGVNAAGGELKLSDYIYYDVFEGVNGETGAFANRDAAMENTTETKKISEGYNKQGELAAGSDYVYLAMVVYMPETVGNEANHNGANIPEIDLGINILATQMAAEEDSFGPDYDEDAWHPAMKIYTAADLQAALANATAGTEIVLQNDIVLTESIVIPAAPTTYSLRSNNAVKLDLNGKTITGTVGRDADGNRIHVLVNNGNLVIEGGTITSAGVNGGSAIYNAAGATMVINGTTINGAPFGDGAWPSYGINNYGKLTVNGAIVNTYHGGIATGDNGVTVINDATVDVGLGTTTKQTSWALYNFDNGQLTVNGGVFRNTKNENNKVYGGGYICPISTGETIINGGIFDKSEGDNNGTGIYYQPTNLVIKAGTFDTDPAAYVADGFKAVEIDGVYHVLVEENADAALYIFNAEQLKAFASQVNGGTHFKGQTVVLMADIDLGGETWTPIGIASNKGFYGTFDGQGHTVSDFTLSTSSGNYGAGFFGNLLGGACVKNLTLDKVSYTTRSNVVGAVAGYLYGSATFENVHVTNADIRSFGKVGGILGMAADPGAHTLTLTNCSVQGNIGGGYNVGGLVGLVLEGQTVNVTDCTTDVVFYMNDGGYYKTYAPSEEGGWMWVYSDTALYAGVSEQYCYYDAEKNEHCMGEVEEVYFVATNAQDLQTALQSGGNVILANDIAVNVTDTAFTVGSGVSAKLDLNGHNIIATSTSTVSVALFSVSGTLEIVGNGTVALTGDNFGWNTNYRYTTINIRETGKVTLGEGVNVLCEASDEAGYGMNYAVDIYTTGVLNINGATLSSNYIVVRCFFGDGVVNVGAGSEIIGTHDNGYGIWLQSSPNAQVTIDSSVAYTFDGSTLYYFD